VDQNVFVCHYKALKTSCHIGNLWGPLTCSLNSVGLGDCVKDHTFKLSACHPEVFTDTWKHAYISVKHNLPYYAVTFTWATCFDSFSKSSSGPFLRYRSLLLTLKMHCGIPNACNFGIMTLYRCMFHQLDRVHSLYVFKTSITETTLYLYF
jgi:hypothetical protein